MADGLEEAIRAGEAIMEAEHLEGAVGSGPRSASPDPENGWMEGIRIIYRRVCQILEKEGIRPIPVVGGTFDPQVHTAVGVEHTFEVPEDTIIEEQRKGYKRRNRVVRYAEVVVAKPLLSDNFPHPIEGEESNEHDHWH